jgi:hypothetical protein
MCIFMCIHMMEMSTLYQHSISTTSLLTPPSSTHLILPSLLARQPPAPSHHPSPSPTCDPTCPRTPRACKPEEMRRASSPSIQSIHPASQTKKCHKSSQAVHPAVHPASPSQHPGLPCEGFPPSLLFTGRVTGWIRLWPWPSDGTYDGTMVLTVRSTYIGTYSTCYTEPASDTAARGRLSPGERRC